MHRYDGLQAVDHQFIDHGYLDGDAQPHRTFFFVLFRGSHNGSGSSQVFVNAKMVETIDSD